MEFTVVFKEVVIMRTGMVPVSVMGIVFLLLSLQGCRKIPEVAAPPIPVREKPEQELQTPLDEFIDLTETPEDIRAPIAIK